MRRLLMLVAVSCAVVFAVTLIGCGGGGGEKLVSAAAKPPPAPPSTPTPSRIAFQRAMTSGSQKGTWQVFSMYTNGTGVTQLTSGASPNSNFEPSWAPDGKICFTSSRDGQRRIYTMNSSGTGQTAVTSPPSDNPGDRAPDWCLLDAGKIAFVRNRPGTAQYSDLWVVEGGSETQLTTSPLLDEWPSFSPDGKSIVFNRRVTGGSVTGELQVVRVADKVVLPLQWAGTALAGTYPDWSPDGTSVVYYYYAELWRVPVNPATGEATGPPQQLTSDGTAPYQYHPTWSPLQDYMTYFTNPGDRIMTRELATGVVRDLALGRFPDWSPAVF